MAITITAADIQAFCPNSLPDAVIDDLICTVQSKIGDCVEAAYPVCEATTILKAAVCHLAQSIDGGEVKSERAPNGASTTYANNGAGEGLKSTQMGRLLLSLDTAGCSNALVAPTFLFLAAGNPATPVC